MTKAELSDNIETFIREAEMSEDGGMDSGTWIKIDAAIDEFGNERLEWAAQQCEAVDEKCLNAQYPKPCTPFEEQVNVQIRTVGILLPEAAKKIRAGKSK